MKLNRLLATLAASMLFVVSANATPISFGFLESDLEQDALWANFAATNGSAMITPADFGAIAGAPSHSLLSSGLGAKGGSSLNAFGGACSPATMLQFQPSDGLCSDKLGARASGGRLVFEHNDDDVVEQPVRAIPEPGTLLMFGIGLLVLGFIGRRRTTA